MSKKRMNVDSVNFYGNWELNEVEIAFVFKFLTKSSLVAGGLAFNIDYSLLFVPRIQYDIAFIILNI